MTAFIFFSLGIVCGTLGTLVVQRRVRSTLADELHYAQVAMQSVGDLCLEKEVRRLRRRLAGLLASPGFYLRARRLLGPLELDTTDLTAELELIEATTVLEVVR